MPSQQKRSIDFIHVREARVMSASRKSTVPAGIGAAPVLSETSVPLCRGMSYLSATCGPCQKGDLRLSMILRPHKLLSSDKCQTVT